jgi:hypothetical protein
MKSKSNPTVKGAVLMSWPHLSDTFRGYELVKIVKIITRRRGVYGDSCLRKMRVLKSEGKINYILAAAKEESLYTKL